MAAEVLDVTIIFSICMRISVVYLKYEVGLMEFLKLAGIRRIQRPYRTVQARTTAPADEYIHEIDSVKEALMNSPLVEFSIVYSATNNFSEKLGEGGFGPVFKVEYLIILTLAL
jgi:hypothetical protein